MALFLVEILGSTRSLKIMLSRHLLSSFFLVECEALLLIILDGDIMWVCFCEYIEEGVDEFIVGL